MFIVLDRWNFEMPAIIMKSIAILSDAGLGMAMFSLGRLFLLLLLLLLCMQMNTVSSKTSCSNSWYTGTDVYI